MQTKSPSPGSRSGTASPAVGAEGYLLLTIQHAIVKQTFEGSTMTLAKGELRVECISLPIPKEIGRQTANPFAPSPSDPLVPTHDFWLVLHVGSTFEMPLIPETYLTASNKEGIAYTVPSPNVPNAFLQLVLPSPGSSADMEDLDSMETLFRQYKCLGSEDSALYGIEVPPMGSNKPTVDQVTEDMKGKLVLVNEETGEIVGQLDQTPDVADEKRLAGDDKNRPVVLDFGHVIEGHAPKVTVQRIREEDMDDWMLKGAHTISQGILGFSSWSQRMMTSTAQMYINKAKPREEPVKFSPTTKANIRRAHNATAKGVNVTKTTMGMINNAILKVVDTAYDKGVKPGLDAYDQIMADEKFDDEKTRRTPPPVPRKSSLQPGGGPGAPALPPRTTSPLKPAQQGPKIDIPPQAEANMIMAEKDLPTYDEITSALPAPSPTGASPSSPTATTKSKRPFLNRVFLAGEVVLSSLEATANDLINTGTAAASSAAGHKFGPEAGHATALLGGSVRNVAVVYIDVRGVGRQALLKGTAKGFVKARMRNGEEVRLQGENQEQGGVQVDAGEVETNKEGEKVVGLPQVQKKTPSGYDVDKKNV